MDVRWVWEEGIGFGFQNRKPRRGLQRRGCVGEEKRGGRGQDSVGSTPAPIEVSEDWYPHKGDRTGEEESGRGKEGLPMLQSSYSRPPLSSLLSSLSSPSRIDLHPALYLAVPTPSSLSLSPQDALLKRTRTEGGGGGGGDDRLPRRVAAHDCRRR